METAWKKAQEPAYIKGWFNDFLVYYQEHGIVPADFWNFNKCGVRLGIAKNQLVWIKKGREVFIPYLNSQELITLVETIHLIGNCITPIIIISGQNLMEE